MIKYFLLFTLIILVVIGLVSISYSNCPKDNVTILKTVNIYKKSRAGYSGYKAQPVVGKGVPGMQLDVLGHLYEKDHMAFLVYNKNLGYGFILNDHQSLQWGKVNKNKMCESLGELRAMFHSYLLN